jgi:outer membrane receptor protein involved in Fe transport
MQEVPFSVTAFTGDDLKDTGVFDIIDLQNTTPSLMTPSTGSPAQGASFRLRGFGSPPFQLGIEPAVPLFMDGVYRSRSGMAVNDLVDVERIEVLKGPQGTLFGKNTTAGLIHVITKKPNTDYVEGFAEVSYEKYNRKRVKGMVNVPIGDNAAFRISGMAAEGDGWLKNPTEDMHNLNRSNVHAQLLFEPSDTLDINFSVNWGEVDENCCAAVEPDNAEDLNNYDSTLSHSTSEDVVYSAEVNWQLASNITLTSITSYQNFDNEGITDGDI